MPPPASWQRQPRTLPHLRRPVQSSQERQTHGSAGLGLLLRFLLEDRVRGLGSPPRASGAGMQVFLMEVSQRPVLTLLL